MKSILAGGVAALATLTSTVTAHYTWPNFIFPDGTVDGPFTYVRAHTNGADFQDPLFDPYSTDLICNIGGLDSGPDTKVAKINAGDTIGFTFTTGIFHIGPLFVYLSRALDDDVQSYDGSGDWFKLLEVAPVPNANTGIIDRASWTTLQLYEYTFEIPESIPAGQYLVRLEHIAVHYANEPRGTQYYTACAQVEIASEGTGVPGPLVKIPGLYEEDDPGILFHPYGELRNYTMPGPAVWEP